MGIFGWLMHGHHDDDHNTRHIDEAMERLLRLSPQLHHARHYRSRLAPAIAASLRHVGGLVTDLAAPREVNAATWSSDPYIHAFFAAPGDIARVLSSSAELRAYFDQNIGAEEAYAVLGMTMTRRSTLGVALEGDKVRSDVAQTTVSFSEHRVRICGRTEADLRQEIVRRGVDQLGLEGLARIAADKSRRDKLERDRALLKTRLQLLERQGAGMRSMLDSGAAPTSAEYARLQKEIEENERDLGRLGIRSEALERELDRLCEVLANPGEHLYLERAEIRLDKMNVELPKDCMQAGDELAIHMARIPMNPPQMRAFALVRCTRRELLPPGRLLDEAALLLR